MSVCKKIEEILLLRYDNCGQKIHTYFGKPVVVLVFDEIYYKSSRKKTTLFTLLHLPWGAPLVRALFRLS